LTLIYRQHKDYEAELKVWKQITFLKPDDQDAHRQISEIEQYLLEQRRAG